MIKAPEERHKNSLTPLQILIEIMPEVSHGPEIAKKPPIAFN